MSVKDFVLEARKIHGRTFDLVNSHFLNCLTKLPLAKAYILIFSLEKWKVQAITYF